MSEPFVIEKNVPYKRRPRAPWPTMEEGDSLFLPYKQRNEKDTVERYALSVYNRAWMWSKRHGLERKWQTSVRIEGEVLGVRIWRLA